MAVAATADANAKSVKNNRGDESRSGSVSGYSAARSVMVTLFSIR